MYADIIIKNGRCVTMCGDGGADWVAAAGKMICAAGRGDDWQKLVRPGEADIAEMPIQYAPATKMYNPTMCEALGITAPEGYEAVE